VESEAKGAYDDKDSWEDGIDRQHGVMAAYRWCASATEALCFAAKEGKRGVFHHNSRASPFIAGGVEMVWTRHHGSGRAVADNVVRRQHSLTGGRVSPVHTRTRVRLTHGPHFSIGMAQST
jgi:hypothetical protein